MRIAALAALLLLGAAPAGQRLPVTVGGRVVAEPGGTMRFGWPGVYFEGRFRATSVTAAVATDQDLFRLYVDDQERAQLSPHHQRITIEGLKDRRHIVRLEKLTERQSGSSRFLGFEFGASVK